MNVRKFDFHFTNRFQIYSNDESKRLRAPSFDIQQYAQLHATPPSLSIFFTIIECILRWILNECIQS